MPYCKAVVEQVNESSELRGVGGLLGPQAVRVSGTAETEP